MIISGLLLFAVSLARITLMGFQVGQWHKPELSFSVLMHMFCGRTSSVYSSSPTSGGGVGNQEFYTRTWNVGLTRDNMRSSNEMKKANDTANH
jgi:hypothetical protein